ncbi:TonB-dependent receptor plug domain-containing protein [Persephonella sp.]
MKKNIPSLISALCLFSLSSAVELEKLPIYSAYKSESPQDTVTSPFIIISEEEINEKKPISFTDIIKNKSGISFTRNGGIGQTTSLYIWGNKTENTVLLIDGIRINDVTSIGYNPLYEHILVDNFNKIEIIKGVQSGVWGADAVGGVINISTQKIKDGFNVLLDGMYGSFSTRKYRISTSYGGKKFKIMLNAVHFKTSGISSAEPKKTDPNYGKRWDDLGWERDPYRNDTVTLKGIYNITDRDKISITFINIDAVTHYDASAGVDAKDYDDPFGYGVSEYFNHTSQKFYKISYNRKTGKHDLNLKWTKSDINHSHYGGYEGKNTEINFSDKLKYKNGFLVIGVSRQDFKNTKSAGVNLNKRYHSTGYYLTNVTNLWDFLISTSIRHDSYSVFKDKTTYKLGFKKSIGRTFFISSNYGTGYKVPTIFQLYGFAGNESLNPENSIQYDISIGTKSFYVTYFNYSIKNLIDYDFNIKKYNNLPGKTKIKGYEIGYRKYINSIRSYININYTSLDTKDSKGNKLLRRPDEKIGFEFIFYPTDSINIGIYGEYIGDRKDLGNINTGNYSVFDSFINYNFSKNVELYLKIINITDKYYQTVSGYATAGRSIYGGLRLQW